ncbi:hypothetical protein PLESTB_001723300 [Pleodorina starrii]|uniref:Uncharacterized protein n=1 Tax=Pleodorina starrii TaxID=330485 RepID=A0A9W6C0C1_9CHLO|nr:hypothetical protein PLESTB_001723300 [Pleodorina starrii]
MDAGRPKKKRSELELLLGNGEAGGLVAFSPRLPALSLSSPALAEATAESDEQLARRLHEELNGMRTTRRGGTRAITEEGMQLSPGSRGVASPHAKPKAETPRAHSAAQQGGQGRASQPHLPSVSGSAQAAAGAGSADAVEARAGAEAGSRTAGAVGAGDGSGPSVRSGPGPGPTAEGGGGETVRRKRNTVPARELHLLLQQASSAAGRGDTALSPIRTGRGSAPASGRTEPSPASSDAQHPHQQGTNNVQQHGSQTLPRRDSDRKQLQQSQQQQQLPAASSASAPVAPSPSPGAPLPAPPSLLPPKLKQRYLAGLSSLKQPGGPASASASASNDAARPDGTAARGGRGGAAPAVAAANPAPTTVTPSCVLSGGRNSLLTGQSLEGSSVQSQPQTLSPSRGHDAAAGVGPTSTPSEAAAAGGGGGGGCSGAPSAASLAEGGPRPPAATGASIGGCSSTDETENDNDNSCAAAVACANGDGGGPSATSPKASLAPPLQLPPPLPASASLKQQPLEPDRLVDADELHPQQQQPQGRPQREAAGASAAAIAQPPSGQGQGKQQPGQGQQPPSSLAGPLKVPKLPMIRAGRGWYRGRLMRESVDGQRVLVDVPGAPKPATGGSGGGQAAQQHGQPFWLPVVSDRIWRGSYKGKDWKYLGDGAWEPKPAAFKRGKQGSSSNGLPLPLPSWAVEGAGSGASAEAEAAPAAAAAAAGVGGTDAATASGQRSKRDRGGWSSQDDTSDDADAPEEQQQQQAAAVSEGPSTRSGLRSPRRSSPALASTFAIASAGSGKAAAAAAPAATPPPAAAVPLQSAAAAAASGSDKEDGAAVTGASAVADTAAAGGAASEAAPVSEVATADRSEAVFASDTAVEGVSDAKPDAGPAAVAETVAATQPKAAEAVAEESPAVQGDEVARGSSQGGASVSASVDCGDGAGGGGVAAATAGAKMEVGEEAGSGGGNGGSGAAMDGEEDGGEGAIQWSPGVAYPRVKRPRRARRRQQRVRTPFDGLQLPLPHHHTAHHNPYSFYPGLSGEESGGDGDASDAEHGGGRRGSGDGAAGAPHQGSRRRAAARAAAVAAAAARAEAEAEEEEQEEILLGRRPPRRDRFQTHSHHGAGGAAANRRNPQSQHHNRSRSGARADYYMYGGDSSGTLDDPYSGDATAHGHGSSARPRVGGSRGNSQPAPEYGAGGSGAWESMQWQQAAGGQLGEGGGPQAQQAPQRNRRKGKPSRSRMDGEGDAWCCGENDWELEAAGGAWARMPEVLRRLYCAPCPAAAAAADDGSGSSQQQQQQQQQQSGSMDPRVGSREPPHRQSGGGAYYGALQAPINKRRRVYDEDPTVSPDDLDLEMEVDDHEHDADYMPPFGGAGGSRRSSGFGGGRRCSVNGSAGGAGAKRHRSGDPVLQHNSHSHRHHHSSSQYLFHQMGHYGDRASAAAAALMPAAAAAPARPRIIVTGWGSGIMGTAGAAAASVSMPAGLPSAAAARDGCIPAGLAGLLEAALGQDAAAAAATAAARHSDGGDATRSGPGVKLESEHAAEATIMGVGAAAGVVAAAAAASGLNAQGLPPQPVPPGDSHWAHVALSDSSAGPSGGEEGKYGGVAAAAAAGAAVDGGGPAACSDGGAAPRLQYSGGGAAAAAAGLASRCGTPPPPPGLQPAGQLRSNTPTRAKRTGRPPSAGAPLPKLPALSSAAASLRLQMAGAPGAAGLPGMMVAVASEGLAAAAVTSVADPFLPQQESIGAEGRGMEEVSEPVEATAAQVAEPTGCLPVPGVPETDDPVGGRVGVGYEIWHAGAGDDDVSGNGSGGGAGPPQACGVVTAAGAATISAAAEVGEADGVAPEDATGPVVSAFNPGAAAAALHADGATPSPAKRAAAAAAATCGSGGGGRCVMDAIGALMYDNQPAMQQLAMRAQLELDSVGLVVTASQRQAYGAVHMDELHQQQHPYRSGRGSVRGGTSAGLLMQHRSGSLSAAGSPTPPAPDPLIASLPSVELVVGLFSARTAFGSSGAQQALADLVGGAAALPLFR